MQGVWQPTQYICSRCWRARAPPLRPRLAQYVRYASDTVSPPETERDGERQASHREKEEGALSRRLAQMSEESLETGGRGARKAVEEAGFSEDLKKELEEKIANANFRSEHASAFAQANMPTSAGRGTRDIAASKPWTGVESVEDASLRMLTDAHKPLKASPRPPGLRGPSKVDTGRPSNKGGAGVRLANARDRSSAYSFTNDPNLSEEEREKLRQEMKARFQPAARPMPTTVQGLASLANERIEDAISRGQFKNLPSRGKKIERDYTASSPFIDTTEYFMNKMIQKQEIVPPWIEKQQELVLAASRFRSRLRADWRRHIARTIASRGGSLEKQMKLADEYALAESYQNPPPAEVEKVNVINEGHLSQITLAGELKPAPEGNGGLQQNEIKILEQTVNDDGTLKDPQEQIIISADQPESTRAAPKRLPTVPPFRDPDWEQTEASYLRTAIDSLNTLARSYNLMAPDLAKKPYFSLERELKSCFPDVAPTVAATIRERALTPKAKGVEVVGHKPGGVLEKFAMDQARHVYDERKPQYGFREFWRDLFSAKS